MGIDFEDFKKIVACLRLTTSDKDGEALAAIRGANRVLENRAATWDTVWRDMEERMLVELESRQPTVQQAFDELLHTLKPSSFRDMILQYQRQWDDKNYLSDRQRGVLFNALANNGKPLRPRWRK